MSYIMMLLAFLVMSGIAAILSRILGAKMSESMTLSASMIVLVLWITGKVSDFRLGIAILSIAGIIGIFAAVFDKKTRQSINAAYIVLALIFGFSMALYYNDFIQHIDELHQWALVVKHMLVTQKLPVNGEFLGDSNQLIGTSLFIVFFQLISGYNESFMYVAAAFLCFLGFLLPFSYCKKSEAYKIILYVAFLYLSIYPLYIYGFKSLYVDLATMSWTCGISVYWLKRDRDKRIKNIVILLAGMAMIFFFKVYVGLLLDFFVVLTVIGDWVYSNYSKSDELTKRKWIKGFGITVFGLICIALILLFAVVSHYYKIGLISKYKLISITKGYVYSFIFDIINTRALYRISPVAVLLLAIVVFLMHYVCVSKEDRVKKGILFVLSCVFLAGYMVALWLAYLIVFNSAESAQLFAIQRYFSIALTMVFMFEVAGFITESSQRSLFRFKKLEIITQDALLVFLVIVFAFGINKNYLADSSSLYRENIKSYKVINKTRQQLLKISDIIGTDDKVFMLNQGADLSELNNKAQVPQNMALYYLGNQVNNCLYQPWKLTEGGSYVALVENNLFSINDLQVYLTAGGYTYFWIYKTDKYLKENLPQVLSVDEVQSASLYRIIYEDNGASRLELVSILDN